MYKRQNLLSEERSDYLQVRCGKWYLPELADKAHALQYTPVGVKIFEHWQRTGDVYYLRRNYDRFMAMQPLTKEQYEGLRSGDVDGFVFPEDHSTDGQFLDDIGRCMNFAPETVPNLNELPPPEVKGSPIIKLACKEAVLLPRGCQRIEKFNFLGCRIIEH